MLPDLAQYIWIAWLVLALVFVIIELLTLEFTFLMLAGGALVGGLGTYLLGGPWWLQIALAAAIAGLLLFTIRPLLLRTLHRSSKPIPTNVDAIFGLRGRVLAEFVDGEGGSVKLDNGETWTARLSPDSPVPVIGTRVVVTDVLGAIVEVTSSPNAEPEAAERTSAND